MVARMVSPIRKKMVGKPICDHELVWLDRGSGV